ncbi:MAG: hypothetical protein ACN6OP_19190 [Pseudomonadales bacterium]
MSTFAKRVLHQVRANWWDTLTKEQRQAYLKEHPDSKYAGGGGASEKPTPTKTPKGKPNKKATKAPVEDTGDTRELHVTRQIDPRRYKVKQTGPETPLTDEGKALKRHLVDLQERLDKAEEQYHREKDPVKKEKLGTALDEAGDEAHDLLVQNWSLLHPGQELQKRGFLDSLSESVGSAIAEDFKSLGEASKKWLTSGGSDSGSKDRKAGAKKAKALKAKLKGKIKDGASWPSIKNVLKGIKSGTIKSTKSVGKAIGTALALSLLGAGAPVAVGAIAYLVGRDFLKMAKKKLGSSTSSVGSADPGPALDTPRVDALGDQEGDAELDALLDQLIDAIGGAELTDEQLQEMVKIMARLEKQTVTATSETGKSVVPPYPKVTFRNVDQWSTYAEDNLDKAHLENMASWRTCNKGTQLVFQDIVWAEWDRATNFGWAYNLKKSKPIACQELDRLVREIEELEFQLAEVRTGDRHSAAQVMEEQLQELRSQIYNTIAGTDQPDRQHLAVRYQDQFAPQGAAEGNPEVQRYHKGLGTYWEPYAAPFGFDPTK